jgi:hypothetical protein
MVLEFSYLYYCSMPYCSQLAIGGWIEKKFIAPIIVTEDVTRKYCLVRSDIIVIVSAWYNYSYG